MRLARLGTRAPAGALFIWARGFCSVFGHFSGFLACCFTAYDEGFLALMDLSLCRL